MEIVSDDPEIEIEEIDIMAAPLQSWKHGIRMIPALKIGTHILSGFIFNKSEISGFISRHKS